MAVVLRFCSSSIWSNILVDTTYPTLTSNYLTKGIADFARHFGIGTRKQVVLVVDQAGWQKARTSKNSLGHTLGVFAFLLS